MLHGGSHGERNCSCKWECASKQRQVVVFGRKTKQDNSFLARNISYTDHASSMCKLLSMRFSLRANVSSLVVSDVRLFVAVAPSSAELQT